MLLVPDAFLWRSESNELGKLLERIAFYLAWAEDHPEVVAVTPFIYQSGSAWIGARDIPASRDRWKQIGQCILAASATP